MPKPAPPEKEAVAPVAEGPKYGGVFTGILSTPVVGFDDAYTFPTNIYVTHLTNEELLTGDWAKGPTGSHQASFLIRGTFFPEIERGCLAESWEIPDSETIIYRIRKGVRFQDRPPVNGREMTADDVVFSIKRIFTTPASYLATTWGRYFKSVTAPDKGTVVVKAAPGNAGTLFPGTAEYIKIVPREVIDKYGNMRDWQNVIGTGPFILKDYVSDSSATLVKNPNYWDNDPLHPQNRLPYLDGVKWLIIQDTSTQQAALRTAKVDWHTGVAWEEMETLRKTNPEAKSSRILQAAHLNIVWMRTDRRELPFGDIRVRRALNVAIDKKAIKDSYYGGNAELFTTPVAPYPELMHLFTPLEKLPESVQELYQYNPEKAKQLLAEAGYPRGFKAEMLCSTAQVDRVAIVKDYWARIGVDLTIDAKEYTVYNSIINARTHKQMVYAYLASVAPFWFLSWLPTTFQNWSMINDQRINQTYDVIMANLILNQPKADQALKEIIPYILEQAWYVELPAPYTYTVWHPWVKGYNGEWTVGYSQPYNFPTYVWLDRDLREKMIGKR